MESFPVSSGLFIGDVESYGIFDAGIGYRIPWAIGTRLSVHAYNIFNNRHQEYVGAPEIGRLVVSQMQVSF